jgi:hypothetical protein
MQINGQICKGHGVASGKSDNKRYPKGTLNEQLPYFKERGLDLSAYFLGTINLDISPYTPKIIVPKYFFEGISWSPYIPPENFYFFDVILFFQDTGYKGLIYMPDPNTKVDHIQKRSILELILPKISGLTYGMRIRIETEDKQLQLLKL